MPVWCLLFPTAWALPITGRLRRFAHFPWLKRAGILVVASALAPAQQMFGKKVRDLRLALTVCTSHDCTPPVQTWFTFASTYEDRLTVGAYLVQ